MCSALEGVLEEDDDMLLMSLTKLHVDLRPAATPPPHTHSPPACPPARLTGV